MITYKGIEHERLGDAPFIGALIIAAQCSGPCKNCFNMHLREEPNLFSTADKILDEVMDDPINEGIILGGLEWSEQPDDLVELVTAALWRSDKIKIMIYTRLTEKEFFQKFPILANAPIWYKFGPYDETQKVNMYYSHGIKLASHNQYIKFIDRRQKFK